MKKILPGAQYSGCTAKHIFKKFQNSYDRRKEERKGKQIENKYVLGKGSGPLEDSGVVLLHFWRKIISY